jgi:hypothetical protein
MPDFSFGHFTVCVAANQIVETVPKQLHCVIVPSLSEQVAPDC